MRQKEWWELEPISFAVSRVYRMEDPPADPPADPPKPADLPPAAVDLSKPPSTMEEALAQIEALRSSAGAPPEWATKRMDQLTQLYRTEERGHAATKAQLAQATAAIEQLKKEGKTVTSLPPEVVEAEVDKRARAIADANAYNEACNRTISKGQAAFQDFPAAMQRLHQISPMLADTPNGKVPMMSREFVEAALECDAPEKVLYELAKPGNMDEASRIMALAPSRQGAALARFAAKLTPATAVSQVAAPAATTVGGNRVAGDVHDLYNTTTSTADWMKERQRQIEANRSPGRRRA